jgi:hypothetical protein
MPDGTLRERLKMGLPQIQPAQGRSYSSRGVSRLNRRCLLKPVFDLVLLRVHRQTPANRAVYIFSVHSCVAYLLPPSYMGEPVTGIFSPFSRS